jgi:hypothetical protein
MKYSHREAVRFSLVVSMALAAVLGVVSSPASAEDGTEKGTFSILFENDIFFNADHDYTNGV